MNKYGTSVDDAASSNGGVQIQMICYPVKKKIRAKHSLPATRYYSPVAGRFCLLIISCSASASIIVIMGGA